MCRCFLLDDLIRGSFKSSKISFLSNRLQWKNFRSEFHFGVFHVKSCKRLSRHRIVFRFARKELSCKHPLNIVVLEHFDILQLDGNAVAVVYPEHTPQHHREH